MLDQNTDRMWYVIGAVIVGAAIVLIMNKTFPQLFASVGETFSGKVGETTNVVAGISPKYGGEITDGVGPINPNAKNLLDASDLRFKHGASADVSQYASTGDLLLDVPVELSTYAGIQILSEDLELKPNTVYLLSYTYQKVAGELVSFGGHTNAPFNNATAYVDGATKGVRYYNQDSVFVANDTAIHEVFVYFKTADSLDDITATDLGIWIQPNRMVREYVAVQLNDLKLVEASMKK